MIECGICYERYQEGQLTRHRETCVLRMVFRCTICNEDYVSREGLWNHLDQHSVEDASKGLYYQEMKAKHKLHQCALCNDQRSFCESSYRIHIKYFHDDYDGQIHTVDTAKKSGGEKNDNVLYEVHDGHQLNGQSTVGSNTDTESNIVNQESLLYTALVVKDSHHSQPKIMEATNSELVEKEVKVEVDNDELNSLAPPSEPLVRGKTADKVYPCPICGRAYAKYSVLWTHKITTHTEPKLKCSRCQTSFHLPNKLSRHMKYCLGSPRGLPKFYRSSERSNDDKPMSMETEGTESANKLDEKHPEVEKEDTTTELRDSFEQPGISTASHQDDHKSKDVEKLPEDAFESELANESQAVTKQPKHSGMQSEPPVRNEFGELVWSCSTCKRTFPSRHVLYRHMAVDHKQSEHKCPHCQKIFPFGSQLRRHEEGCSQLRCHQCGISFKSLMLLKRHELNDHTNNQHSHGSKVEDKKEELKSWKHQKIHRERPVVRRRPRGRLYPCSICGRDYTTDAGLWRHKITIHTEPRLECSFCHKLLHFSHQLDRHVASCSARRCHKCDIMFPSRTSLDNHKTSMHALDDEPVTIEAEDPESFMKTEETYPEVKEERTTADDPDGFERPRRSTSSIKYPKKTEALQDSQFSSAGMVMLPGVIESQSSEHILLQSRNTELQFNIKVEDTVLQDQE